MNKTTSRILTVLLIAAGVFLISVTTVFLLSQTQLVKRMTLAVRALAYGSVVALLSLPVLLILILGNKSLNGYSAYALEELELSETELNDAVSNWVFAKHGKKVEEDVLFLEDEEGRIVCRTNVRCD